LNKEEYLKNLMEIKSGSVKAFSEYIDLAYTTVRSILSRGIMNAKMENVIKICSGLGIRPEDILEIDSSIINDTNRVMVQLDMTHQNEVLSFSKKLLEQKNWNNTVIFPSKHNTTTIEVDGVLSAGVGEYLDDNSEPFPVTVPAPVPDNYDYAFKINGSSMEPYYHDGQVVFIKKVGQYRDGQTVAAIYDGCAYLKRLAVDDDGYATLVSLNPDYPNVRIDDKEGIKLLGVVFS